MTTRRNFLGSLLAASAAPKIGWAAAGNPAFLACAKVSGDSFALFGLTGDGRQTFQLGLPERGHAGAGHPTLPYAVVFGRRPGIYALVIDCAAGTVLHQLTPPEGQQFNGHGVFLQGGAVLATSEQSADTSQGAIGLWDVAGNYARIGQIQTQGIGPHELRLMADDATLIVANGGIATDGTDRTKLNIPDMAPNLTYLTAAGGVVEQVSLDPALHQNSIRHLAVRPDGLVAFAMQWEGEGAARPLLGLHRRGQAVVLASAPLADETVMQGYAGSVAVGSGGDQVAITSPKGGRVHIFDAAGGFVTAISRADVCGLVGQTDGFMVSDGAGALLSIRNGLPGLLARHDCSWDNHIIQL